MIEPKQFSEIQYTQFRLLYLLWNKKQTTPLTPQETEVYDLLYRSDITPVTDLNDHVAWLLQEAKGDEAQVKARLVLLGGNALADWFELRIRAVVTELAVQKATPPKDGVLTWD